MNSMYISSTGNGDGTLALIIVALLVIGFLFLLAKGWVDARPNSKASKRKAIAENNLKIEQEIRNRKFKERRGSFYTRPDATT